VTAGPWRETLRKAKRPDPKTIARGAAGAPMDKRTRALQSTAQGCAENVSRNPNRLGANMKLRHLVLALLLALLIATPTQSQPAAGGKAYVPDLGDIMGAAQFRHFKLWFAGRSQNWELARYEIEQIRRSFEAAANYYPRLEDADLAAKFKVDGYAALDALKSAVEARSNAKFGAEFDTLTQACNACHRATHFAFIQIQVPTASPFSNQSFVPPPK
jgi:hypothetical protein